MNNENEIRELDWDPEEAKKMGSLKGIVEFKVDAKHTSPVIEFSEPKAKKKRTIATKVVDLKRNKNSLF